jgi:glycine cleavage system regulatory protein
MMSDLCDAITRMSQDDIRNALMELEPGSTNHILQAILQAGPSPVIATRIATLEAQLAAAREVIAADDEYFAIPRGFDALLTTDGLDARMKGRTARKAAEQLDRETTDAP